MRIAFSPVVEVQNMFWTFAVVYPLFMLLFLYVFVDSRPLVRAFLTNVGMSENGVYPQLWPFSRDNDQQNHWV